MGKEIIVDTSLVSSYINNLRQLERKAENIEKSVYGLNGIILFNLQNCQITSECQSIINKNLDYLNSIINEVDKIEYNLMSFDSLNYKPPKDIFDYVQEGIDNLYDFGEGIINTTCLTVSQLYGLVSEGGPLYKPWKMVWAAGGMISSLIKISSALAAMGLSSGTLSPVSVVVITFSLNQLHSYTSDFVNLYTSNDEKVGKVNVLKDAMEEGGEIISEGICGDSEIGKGVANFIYNIGDGFEDLSDLTKTYKNLVSSGINFNQSVSALKELMTNPIQYSADFIIKNADSKPTKWLFDASIDTIEGANVGKEIYKLFSSSNSFTESMLKSFIH